MMNTKNLKPAARKHRKRAARKEHKALIATMTREEHKAFRKEEKDSLKVFLEKRRAAAAKKAEADKKAEAEKKPEEEKAAEPE